MRLTLAPIVAQPARYNDLATHVVYIGGGTRVRVAEGSVGTYLVIGVVLAALCAWLGWQVYRLQATVKDVGATLESRTTELESARLQLQRLSTEDGLTALANHEQFLEFVEREWRRARRD